MDGKSEKGRRSHGEWLATLPPDQSTEASLPHSPSTVALLRDLQLYLGRSLLSWTYWVGLKSWTSRSLHQSDHARPHHELPWDGTDCRCQDDMGRSNDGGTKLEWRWPHWVRGLSFLCFAFVFFVLMELSEPHPQHCTLCTRAHKCFQRSTMPREHRSVSKSQGTHTTGCDAVDNKWRRVFQTVLR